MTNTRTKLKLNLTPGTFDIIFTNQKDHPLFKNPIVQVYHIEAIKGLNSNKNRIKANISDGKWFVKAVFSTKFTGHFDSTIKNFYFIKISDFEIRRKGNNLFLYVKDIEDFCEYMNLVGGPVMYSDTENEIRKENVVLNNVTDILKGNEATINKRDDFLKKEEVKKKDIDVKQTYNQRTTENTRQAQTTADAPAKKQKTAFEHTPIGLLNPFNNNWTILARCLSKSNLKTFTNAKGEGKLFSAQLGDSSGTIKAIGFSEAVDLFHPILEVNQVFTISSSTLRVSNKKFDNSTSEYEIVLDKNSQVKMIRDESVPKFKCNYKKIDEIKDKKDRIVVDVIGVIRELYAVVKVNTKSGTEQTKRDLLLQDETGVIKVTLWGEKTEMEIKTGDVLGMAQAVGKEWNGMSLSHSASTIFYINPDTEESFMLKGWYDSKGKDVMVRGSVGFIDDLENKKMVEIVGAIIFVNEDITYSCCENCKKKVLQIDDVFRCEKCNCNVEPGYRYLIKMQVADCSDSIYLTVFDEQARTLLGVPAEEFKDAQDNEKMLKDLVGKRFLFKVIRKAEIYNGMSRYSHTCRGLVKLDEHLENVRMLKAIEESITI